MFLQRTPHNFGVFSFQDYFLNLYKVYDYYSELMTNSPMCECKKIISGNYKYIFILYMQIIIIIVHYNAKNLMSIINNSFYVDFTCEDVQFSVPIY